MITPSFGLTATERVLPKLALDFTTASLDPRITFARALDTATIVNSNGYIESVNADVARFDYDPVTKVCKGILIEESRSNFALYSSEFSNVYWGKTQSSITSAAAISPSGAMNASKLVDTAVSSQHFINTGNINFTSGVAYTASIFAKAGERRYLNISFPSNAFPGDFRRAFFDLQTGQVSFIQSNVIAVCTPFGDGWFKCSITVTANATAAGTVFYGVLADGTALANSTYVGDGVSGIYIWGAQTETGAFPTSYIPTTTTSLTRNADVATMTGTNFSDWYSNDAGTFMCQAIPNVASSPITRQMMTVDTISPLYINQNSTSFRSFDGTAVISFGVVSANTLAKCAVSYDVNGRSVSHNASTPVTGTYDGSFGTTTFNIGSNGSAFFWNGHIQKINWYKQKLLNAEVQAITK